jgi:hypothetical protein
MKIDIVSLWPFGPQCSINGISAKTKQFLCRNDASAQCGGGNKTARYKSGPF